MTTTASRPPLHRHWPRSFADRLTAPLPTPRDMVRILREGGFRGSAKDADRIPVLRTGLPDLPVGTTALTWAGHASYVIRIGGACVLADPVWSPRIPGVPRRLTPPGIAWSDLPRVDAVVISHNHYDHLDAPTIRRLPRATPFFVPAGLGRWFTRRGFTRVTELDWWESAEVTVPAGTGGTNTVPAGTGGTNTVPAGTGGTNTVRLDFVPAHHWSRRSLYDTCRSLWGGWVITDGDGQRVYHAGDTGYGHWFAEIGRRYPGIDVAMLPIGAYAPRWFMRPVHMDPDEAVQAHADLGARRLATMHWGTFVLTQEPVLEPLERVRGAWAATGRDREDLWDLAVGETRALPVG